MKITKQALAALSAVVFMALIGCATGPKAKIVELENKGTSMNVSTPEWIKSYTSNGITAVQKQSQFKDKYCIIGEESGVNKQFVLAWADSFSAQQRIGAMLRTNIASEYQARVTGIASSTGGANSSAAQGGGSGEYKQEIDSAISAIVNVSYSGAQREADWWSLRRRYDPDQKDLYTDEYTAYVLYTIPKAELNRQVAAALETAVSKDSALYDITISMARQILQNGMTSWLEPPPAPDSASGSTSQSPQVAAQGGFGSQDYNPRIRATEGGAPVDWYIARAELSGDYLVVYLSTKASDDMPSWTSISGWAGQNVLLQDLDSPAKTWNAVRWSMTTVSGIPGSLWAVSFEKVTGYRFRLSDTGKNPNQAFSEFSLRGK